MRIRCTTAVALLALSCGSDGDSGDDGGDGDQVEFDRRAMLAHLGEAVILPSLDAFAGATDSLSASVDAYCEAIAGPDEAAALDDARAGWREAMTWWQQLELLQIGPASSSGGALRDAIYSWPIVSACAVDQDVMILRADPGAYDISTRLPNRRGLDALEYALFAPTLESACPPQSAPEGWDALSDEDRRAARCAFAAAAVADLRTQAVALANAWSPSGGDYLGELVDGPDPHAAVDVVFGALFYLDGVTKDDKLAAPAGMLTNNCDATGAPCATELESQHARHSAENIAANVAGFRHLFFGDGATDDSAGPSFDDFLRAAGADQLADDMRTAVDAAEVAVGGIPTPMADALDTDYDAITTAHDRVKAITDHLKSDVPATLNLTIPNEAGGDAD